MAKVGAEYKAIIKQMARAELELAVMKLAEKRENFDYLLVNFLDTESGETELFERAKSSIDTIYEKSYKGRSTQHKLAKMLIDCNKVVSRFSVNCKTKTLEVDLLIYALEKPFSQHAKHLGTKNSTFDSKMALILKKLIGVIEKKLHEDYKLDYEERINSYLTILHRKSDHLLSVSKLPHSL